MSFGSSDVVRTFTLRDRTGATVWTQAITLAMQRSYSAVGQRRSRCSHGSRVGSSCTFTLYPSSGGLCIVIDATARAFAGGCALSTDAAASAWSYGEGEVV